ncbi:MAG TPA: ABC transporter permease [Puia sp.]|nr:ABC transporter permease [Puia sp.]
MVKYPPTSYNKALPYVGILMLGGLWHLVKLAFLRNNNYIPWPAETILRAYGLMVKDTAWKDMSYTLQRFIVGYAIAVAAGIPAGMLLGYFKKSYALLGVIVDFCRSIPVTALFPLFILFFGISSMTITAMVTTSCVFVILLNTAYGVIYVNENRLRMMRSLHAGWLQQFREVIFFEALPFIFVGLRISVSFALIVVVVVEMFIGTQYGLGSRIYKAYETFLVADVYALILIIGVLGYAVNKLILLAERRCIHWKRQESIL